MLLQRLRNAGIKPGALAKALDVSAPMASMMMSGKRGIPTWHLDRIAVLLETDVPNLFVPAVAHPKTAALKNKGDRLTFLGTGSDVQLGTPASGGSIDARSSSQARLFQEQHDELVRAAVETAEHMFDVADDLTKRGTHLNAIAFKRVSGSSPAPTKPAEGARSDSRPGTSEVRPRRKGRQ